MEDDEYGKELAKKYYEQESKEYIKMYSEEAKEYPANLIRLKMVIELLKKNNVKTVLDAGCGTCGPMIEFLKEGFDVKGFDFSEKMLKEGRKELEKANFSQDLIFKADLEDDSDMPDEKFDAIIALGIFPHILDEQKALSILKKRLNDNGVIYIEFRNELFSAFTLNKYSFDFFVNNLINLKSLPENVSKDVVDFYSDRLKIDIPDEKRENDKIAYNEILAKFHNPLNIEKKIFRPVGLSIVNFHFYHFHALPPVFESKDPHIFRELSLKMEKGDDWRGYLM
ncbi:MAG: methyltransferase domain-containing protein, partial [Nanohaloarchaea archaeon]|nr:methyltransferase domain-containing protein [Candidatus Nanohaloarchaea archaeon]